MELIVLTKETIDEIGKFLSQSIYKGFSKEKFMEERADDHLLVVEEGTVLARGSVWYKEVPRIEHETVGVIGHFEAVSGPAAKCLLDRGCLVLKEEGCSIAVGPMDGSTWRKYRLVTFSEGAPPFLLEPGNPAEYQEYFRKAGFTIHQEYSSVLDEHLDNTDNRLEKVEQRLEEHNVGIRAINKDDFYNELSKIYDLSVESFKKNPLYMDIPKELFIRQYEVFKDAVHSNFVLIAEQGSKIVGFLFGYPNVLEGEKTETIILKTLAVSAEREYMGLGALLVAKFRENAKRAGFRKAIYALMHKSNTSLNLAKKYDAKTIREYALFERNLLNEPS